MATPDPKARLDLVRDIAGISGAALIAVGAGLIFLPAGVIVAGAFLLGGALLSAWKGGA